MRRPLITFFQCIPQFYYIKVGFKGVFIARTYFLDVQSRKQEIKVYRIIIYSEMVSCFLGN